MGPVQLWLLLLLLLSSDVLTQDGPENGNPACSKDATRFKHLRKYVYNYEAEIASGVKGTADSRSGSKITCKVELEVPQLCSFILKTSQCTLREMSGVDAEGKTLLKKSKNSDDFARAMAQYELKFSTQDGKKVQLYSERDEPMNILNIKRGIISALIVPMETEDNVKTISMDTAYGKCDSEVEVKDRKGNIASVISINRNLKTCDNFNPIRNYVSPIALIKGLNSPLATLLSSSQSCQYTIDSKKRHVAEVDCREKHLFLPSSYRNQYGMMAQVTQTLKLDETPKINSRSFDEDVLEKRGLSLENADTKSLWHGDAVLKILQELQKLSASQQNQQRASLFYKFVTGLRSLHNDTLGTLVPKMMATSSSITVQGLIQCGTPECYGAILQIIRTGNVDPLVADAVTYSLGLLPFPCTKRIREILNMAQYQQSRASFYALSLAVTKFYDDKTTVTQEIMDVANFMESMIGNECSGNDELTYLTLRAIGNMGKAMEAANPNLKSALKTCIKSEVASPSVQKAAIQALRKMSITDEDRAMLLKAFQNADAPVDKRLAAYLMLMKGPSPSDLNKITRALLKDKSEQVKSFVASHIANILDSEEVGIEDLKKKVKEALKGSQIPSAKDFRKFSQNYQTSKRVSLLESDPVSATLEGNLIFDPNTYIPKETMLKTTLQLSGVSPMDIFEIGMEGKSFEPTLEALFGQKGFFPDTASKALYWVDGRVSEHISKVLFDYFGYSKDEKQDQDVMKGIMLNLEKLIKEMGNKEIPEARAYLRILGEELGYMKLNDFKLLGNMILKSIKTLQAIPEKIVQAISKGTEGDLFLHYIFMDNEFELPTGAGLQLQVAFSGIATPGAKAGVKIQPKNMQADLIFKPSVAIEFVTHVGVNIPAFARSGVQMISNIFHESGIEARVGLRTGHLKLSIPAPKTPTKLFSFSNTLHLVSPTKTEVIPPLIENRESWTSCKPFFPGLNYCTKVAYSNASYTDAAPYYPLTGETRLEVEIQPTGEVQEYSANANYDLQREGNDLVDTLKFTTEAKGARQCEATLTFRYNRDKKILTSDVQIPNFDIDFGTNFRVNDESNLEMNAYTFILDISNKKVPEITVTGRIRYDGKRDAMLGGAISIPRLQTELRTEALLHHSPNRVSLQMESSAAAYGNSVSEKVVFTYDNEKLELEWNSGTSTAVKKMTASFPVDFSDYPKALQKHANELLDRKVANTDMTLRHIVSQFIMATGTWLTKASKDVPYAQTLQDKLSGLQELNIQTMGLPVITIPEELFLKSDGRIKYIWNKDNVIINIPLPFGGRSSHDIRMPKTVKTPQLVMESIGINVPSQEYQLPPFTVPESYQLHVPLLGTLEVSTNVYSNYYNWSASYTVANTTKDVSSMRTSYQLKADSIFDLLSYDVQGSGEAFYDKNTFECTYESSLHHRLLDSNFKFIRTNKYEPTVTVKQTISLTASSTLGTQLSFSTDTDFTQKNNLNINKAQMQGELRVASVFAKGIYTLSSTYNKNSHELAGQSNLTFDSSYLQATNQITGRFTNDVLSITSVSNVQSGIITNTASLKYENSQLKVMSETNARYQNLAGRNEFGLTLAKQMAAVRSEYQATYKENRYYTLLSGSLNSQGLELNADVAVNDRRNRAAHKSTLRMNQDGLASSATTNLQFNPLMLQQEMNARIDASGGTLAVTSNGRYGKHNAKFSIDGRMALMEIALGSVYQSTILGVDSKNILNFRVNREGLKFSNNLIGSYKEMKLEHVNELNIPGLSLTFTSKLDNTIRFDKFHKHYFDLQLQPYSLTAKLNNDLKYSETDVTNKAQLRLEPLKLTLAGNVRGAYRTDEVKHTYTITYADLAANFKTDTVAKIQGAALSHRINLDVAGLASSITINTNCDAKSLHFTNVVRSAMAPFTITADVHTNGDGRLFALGEHTGQLYSKFLFKAEPLAFTFSHDYKGSTSHSLMTEKKHTTLFDNKIHMLFTPSEQSCAWKLKSQVNNNVYRQDLGAYNDAEKTGVELSGQALADLTIMDSLIQVPLMTEPINLIDVLGLRDAVEQPQEFSISGSVKYDKNKNEHVINLPFLEHLPVYFEQIRAIILSTLQSTQRYLKNINIDLYVRKYRATMDKLPQQVNDYMDKLDFKSKVNSMKEKLVAFTKDYRITADDLQIALENARIHFQEALSQLQIYLTQIEQHIRENYDQYDFRAVIEKLIDQIVEKMKVLDQQYKISATMINTIQDLQSIIAQYDLRKIESSVTAWIQNMDAEYKIIAQIQEKLEQLKIQIHNIDARRIAENLKQQVQAVDIKELLSIIRSSLPVQKMNDIIEQIIDILLNLMEDYEVSEKISAFRGKMHDMIMKYELDKQAQFLMDRMIQLSDQYKVKETVQKLTISLKKMDIKSFFVKIVTFVDDTVKKVQTFDYQKLVDEVNKFLDMVIKKLKSFDYNQFVDETNKKIQEITQKINAEIRTLELPQKAEALKQYMKEVYAAVSKFMEQLRDTKLTAIIDWFRDLLNSTAFADLKARLNENLEDLRDRIYGMDIPKECQRYLQKASQFYDTIFTYISYLWDTASEKIALLAEQYDVKNWAEKVNVFVETGFNVPEIRTGIVNIPAFEVSLRALREATFQTPDFIVPLTDLHIPSYRIHIKKLKDIQIPVRFTTPEFTILNTYKVPSYTIDLNEIKVKIVKTIDQMMSSEFQLPVPDMYFREFKMKDMLFSDISFPEIHIPEPQIPEFLIPKLNLNEFQIPNIQIPEFQFPRIPHTVAVPTFGKLSGAFRISSPFFTLSTLAGIHNTTASVNSPEFVATVSAQATSRLDFLAFTMNADVRLSAPELQQLILKETMKVTHTFLKVDHNSEVIFLGTSVQGKAETTTSLHTTKNLIEVHNNLLVKLQRKILMQSKTTYSHRLNIPQADLSSQADLMNDMTTELEAGHVSFISSGKGNWKWASPDFSDEGTHDSRASFTIEGPIIEFIAENRINDKYLKINQNVKYECGLLNYATLHLQSDIVSQNVAQSILSVIGTGKLAAMTVEIKGSHMAKLNGRVAGTINNNVSVLVQPFEISVSTNNDGNVKVSFPFKLTGKIDFLNNYDLGLSSSGQYVHWQASGRFNQYKYSHSMSAENNEDKVQAHVGMNGEANLDFLNIPLSIPELHIPYVGIKTSQVMKGYSLWEQTGLKDLLKTTKQSFDLNLNAQYKKNKDMHSLPLPLKAVHEAINQYTIFFNRHFEKGRDNALDFLTNSYNKAKTEFDKYKVETSLKKLPRTFRIPGYTIPVVNIEVSPFTAELPAFGYVIPKEISTTGFTIPLIGFSVPSYTLVLPSLELPVLHVPRDLRKLKLPKFTMRSPSDCILIPALGNITYDFSFKSSVITLNTNARLFNQSDVVARFSSSSSSVIDSLQFNLDGTTSLTRKRGLKLATALSLSNNKFVEGKHESTVSLTKRNLEASVTTNAKINMPVFKINFKQELTGNTKSKPTLSSAINLNYDFDTLKYGASAKGAVDHKLTLESLTSYISVETSTKGNINGMLFTQNPFSGTLIHEANTYLNSNGARSSLKLEANSKADGIWNVDLTEKVAVEASTHRVYAIWEHNSENFARCTPLLTTRGTQSCRVTLELVPWSMSAAFQIQATQPNSFLDTASVNQGILMNINTENQKLGWKGEGQIQSLSLSHDMQFSNEKSKAQFDISGSLEGHVDFLKNIVFPVYEKSLWDILKLDLTTSGDQKQYLNTSASLVYTKSEDGYFFPLDVNILEDGFTFTIPEVHLEAPDPVLTTPEFQIPFTTLQVPSYTIDLRNIKVPHKLSIMPFDINIPSLPKMRVPKIDVGTKHIKLEEYKIPYFEIIVPQYQITLSQFTLPKSISLGNMYVDLNAVANKIADFDLPTITIPEQKIEIPPLKISLPAGIYFPAFGALTESFRIVSPLYNVTWKEDLRNNKNSFTYSIASTCSSTLQFLEYDLDIVSTSIGESGMTVQKRRSTFSHRDMSTEYKEDLTMDGFRVLAHTASLSINSPTFTDVQMRYWGDSNRISSSISSPSAGTLGYLVEMNTDILQGKIYYKTQSASQKEIDILKGEISIKKPDLIQIKTNWNEAAATDVLIGLKENVPKMTEALYTCINKYHREHTGMEISAATQKLKNIMQNKADKTYQLATRKIDEMDLHLRKAAYQVTGKYQEMTVKAKQLYQGAADQADQIDYQQIRAKIFDATMDVIREYHKKVKHLIDSAIEFLKITKFRVPGLAEKYTGEELYIMATEEAAKATDLCISKMQQYFDVVIGFVNEMEVKVPASDRILKGSEVLDQIKTMLKHLQNKARQIFATLQEADFAEKLRQLKEFVQQVFQKVEETIRNLKSKNVDEIKVQVQQMYNDAINSDYVEKWRSSAENIKTHLSQLKDFNQQAFQEISEKLHQILLYVKALREEYFDPSVVGWSVKYYEVEEKVLAWFKNLLDALVDWHAKYIGDTADLVSRLTDQVREFVESHGQMYYDLVTDANGKGKQKAIELSSAAQENIRYWSEIAKRNAAEYNKLVKVKIQNTYDQLCQAYERLINVTQKLIDLTVENYSTFLQYITKLLHQLEKMTTDSIRPYIAVRQGELRIDVPKPFDWQSVYQMPQLYKEASRKKLEITRMLIQKGIDQGSETWIELQKFIDQQLAAEHNVQQIMENIQKRIKT
ncbi:apolipoprotein B-100 [Emydura macquarii macquarii]|uniref:apolipoprotein B-100 n=1 Tax=Emydura macquarii macquarii TaxID=1129001 RepID=UPI00352B6CE9